MNPKKNVVFDAAKKNLYSLVFYAVLITATTLFLNFIARFAVVNGPSMEPTLRDGDVVLVWQLRHSPDPGDIVITHQNNPLGIRIVKRVVAIGGQSIQIKNERLKIDGIALPESYLPESGDFSEIVIPDGHVFLLGDNRGHSTDSREIGSIPKEGLMGKVMFRVFPFSEFGPVI